MAAGLPSAAALVSINGACPLQLVRPPRQANARAPALPRWTPAVYDITNTPNSHANEAIKTLNRFTRDTFGLGGIFHGAVEVNGEEYSFGYCPYGTGVRRRRMTLTCRREIVSDAGTGLLVRAERQPQLHV